MTIITSRRSILLGAFAALVAAPAIVRASSLMRIKGSPLTGIIRGSLNSTEAQAFYNRMRSYMLEAGVFDSAYVFRGAPDEATALTNLLAH